MMYMSYLYIHPCMHIDVSYICACATEFKYVEVLKSGIYTYTGCTYMMYMSYMYIHTCMYTDVSYMCIYAILSSETLKCS